MTKIEFVKLNYRGITMENYKDTQGILIQKYRNLIGQYIFVLLENNSKIKVNVGKGIYMNAKIGSEWIIGHLGRKLINVRLGCWEKS